MTALHNDRSAQIDTSAGPMLVMRTMSQVNRWQYVTAIPVSVVMQRIDKITSTFTIVASAAFFLVLCIAVLLAYKDSRPIHEVIGTLSSFAGRENKTGENDFDFIKGTINKLISMNEHLQADMKDQEILIKNIFFERLLRNRFNHHDEMINHMKNAHISLPGTQFVVLLARMKGYYGQVTQEMLGEMTEVRVLIMNILNQELSHHGYLHPIDEMTVAAVIGMTPGFDIHEMISGMLKMFNRYNIIISFGIGRPRNALTAIWESFYEAEKALEQSTKASQVISIYDHSLSSRNAYYYPIDIESKLMSLVKAGEKKATGDVLDTVFVKNNVEKGMADENNALLICELCGTLTKLNDDLFSDDAEQHDQTAHMVRKVLSGNVPIKELKSINDIFMMLCDHVATKKQSHNIQLRDEILLYLNEHYTNPDISLYSVAARFDLAENYFSRFFKEQSGENFSNYLERIRMEKARDLLDDGGQMISDVARSVGYYNINTFYKAFRRIYGISPRMYQKNNCSCHGC
jgi:AraC-like DNA-binding protein